MFALKGMDDSDSDAAAYDDADAFDEDSEDDSGDSDEDDEEPAPPSKPSKKAATTKSKSKSSKDASDDEMEERWGKNKSAYYSSNAPELDSDDEEARLLEEQEAIRLQAKARDGLGEDDFGLLSISSPGRSISAQ